MLAALAPERAKLLVVRRARPQPPTDTKIVTGLNGLAIGALARAAGELGAPKLNAAAEKAATRLWQDAYDAKTGLLHHEIIDGKAEVDGFLEDYAMLGDGFLDLAKADGEESSGRRTAVERRRLMERAGGDARRCDAEALRQRRRTALRRIERQPAAGARRRCRWRCAFGHVSRSRPARAARPDTWRGALRRCGGAPRGRHQRTHRRASPPPGPARSQRWPAHRSQPTALAAVAAKTPTHCRHRRAGDTPCAVDGGPRPCVGERIDGDAIRVISRCRPRLPHQRPPSLVRLSRADRPRARRVDADRDRLSEGRALRGVLRQGRSRRLRGKGAARRAFPAPARSPA